MLFRGHYCQFQMGIWKSEEEGDVNGLIDWDRVLTVTFTNCFDVSGILRPP